MTIICYDVAGNAVPVNPDAITFRPAVYGIFIENRQILLLKHPENSLLSPPGQILADNQVPAQAIRHYLRNVTGITPTLGPLIFLEDLYQIDAQERAWHLSAMYYALTRPRMTSPALLADLPGSAENADSLWLPLADLKREQLAFGYEAIQAGRLNMRL